MATLLRAREVLRRVGGAGTAALPAQVGVVLSEDFNPGAVLDGVSFTNPLDPEFDLAALG
jgi:hypothetical protein